MRPHTNGTDIENGRYFLRTRDISIYRADARNLRNTVLVRRIENVERRECGKLICRVIFVLVLIKSALRNKKKHEGGRRS